ncbi:MAG: PHB depolymerase family esterase [Desulfobacteraceae bacterium]
MAYQFVHKGVVREFDFHAPFAWHYWHERAFAEDGRSGLPLVVALHGGGQDLTNFMNTWDFYSLINVSDENNWQDRFFVLYPYGFDSNTAFGALNLKRSWNVGFAGEYLPVQSDVSFIRAAIDALEEMLRHKLHGLGISRPAIDPDRRYVFGYSAGGMMAYKLAHEIPDYFGALWVMAGAYGGRAHEGLTATVTNDPQGASSVSLFAHHGEDDTVVPPGPRQDPTGRVQPDTAFEVTPGIVFDIYDEAGIPAGDAPIHNNAYRTLAAAVEEFRRYNDCEPEPVAPVSGSGKEDMIGGTDARQYVFHQASGAVNPEVTVYRDGAMNHANYSTASKKYVDVTRIWNWFKDHPRMAL